MNGTNPPKSSRPDGLLTYADLSAHTGHHVKTIQRWASKRRPMTQRLRTVRLSRKTVLVRPNDWEMFMAAGQGTAGRY